MSVSSLREITVGVQDLHARTAQFETGCGLEVLTNGTLTSMTASRLFDSHAAPRGAVLGRPDVEGSVRVRLVEAGDGPLQRTKGISAPGPLGIGFSTRGTEGVVERLARSGVQFISSPMRLPSTNASPPAEAGADPETFEAFGRAPDGDFLALCERRNAATSCGTLTTDCSEPVHALFVVTNLDASHHFLGDVLKHEIPKAETRTGPPFDVLLGLPKDVSFRLSTPHPPGRPTGGLVLMEFERKLQPMLQLPALARGLCRLRYDTADLHTTLLRLPGGGGSLVRGPASVDDPVLGNGLVAMVRAPFGVLIELWQTL